MRGRLHGQEPLPRHLTMGADPELTFSSHYVFLLQRRSRDRQGAFFRARRDLLQSVSASGMSPSRLPTSPPIFSPPMATIVPISRRWRVVVGGRAGFSCYVSSGLRSLLRGLEFLKLSPPYMPCAFTLSPCRSSFPASHLTIRRPFPPAYVKSTFLGPFPF